MGRQTRFLRRIAGSPHGLLLAAEDEIEREYVAALLRSHGWEVTTLDAPGALPETARRLAAPIVAADGHLLLQNPEFLDGLLESDPLRQIIALADEKEVTDLRALLRNGLADIVLVPLLDAANLLGPLLEARHRIGRWRSQEARLAGRHDPSDRLVS